MNLVETIANVSGTLGLALFVIVVLQRTWKHREEQLEGEREVAREDRERLLEVIARNTEAWVSATATMGAMTEAVCQNRRNLEGIRVLMARRPCIGTDALEERD